jgi:hypothetical protein
MRHLLWSSTLFALVVACGGATSGSTGSESGSSGSAAPPAVAPGEVGTTTESCTGVSTNPICDAPIDVSSQDDVFSVIAAMPESTDSSTKKDAGEKLRPTRDMRASTTFELDVLVYRQQQPMCPEGSEGGPGGFGGCMETVFTGEQNFTGPSFGSGASRAAALPPGVTCTATSTTGCTKIEIAQGTVIRFARATTPNGFGNSFPHFIRVTRACAAPCAADEIRCAASTTCIKVTSFCSICEGRSNEVCACRKSCTVDGDGAACYYDTSDDTGASGTCKGGTCL